MEPRRESKVTRVLRWQHALLGVLLLSSLIYASLMLSWTLRDPDTMQGRATASIFQHNKQWIDTSRNNSDLQASVDNLLQDSAEQNGVVDYPSNISQVRRLKCIGWRATSGCSPSGSRVLESDQDCNSTIPQGTAGYCEVEDLDSHERFMIMKRTCAEAYRGASIRCNDAPGFANFRAKAQIAADKALEPGYALPNTNRTDPKLRQGIVMVVYPKLVASTYATVRALREVLGCSLPIEIWLRPDEMNKVPGALEPLWDLARNKSKGEITFQAIRHQNALHFNCKVYAIYHSKFEQVLFLDADNVPVRDPSYLFTAPEFVKTGAVFWPDFWHPDQTIFFINPTSLVWQLLDMPFVDMFEQESGQLLIDRKRHAAPLALVTFYAFHQPNYFNRLKLAWGDKDLFRFAWLKLGASFHMIETPPAVAGELKGNLFCGMTMAQHDPSGDVIFLHRNQLKLTGEAKLQDFDIRLKKALSTANTIQANFEDDEYPDPAIWTHLVSFRGTSPRSEYLIEKHASINKFTGIQRCFGGRELHKNPHFYAQEFTDFSFTGLESHLRRFAMKAAQLRQRKTSQTTT
ncbi:hypothetical protein PR003_g21016 [Phytophthora rubi]|uniref:Nucleotide-diphospho-sugar transferase domain-containing protein n=1 Tax=Phytophthora rubi TaxID=129364 RepID=A0A6A3JM00_9STRA|nr:hypothetical protein PR002_g20323 [Phytophthora rubi]KAE8996364.1 hypothetical protein PR001_g19876 [Phytophthora rubi]KAE9307352.1 hypothetical protein PR003_g21016 [Phytophthora rubi]